MLASEDDKECRSILSRKELSSGVIVILITVVAMEVFSKNPSIHFL